MNQPQGKLTGLAIVLTVAFAAAGAVRADPHPFLADTPANAGWLAPKGTGHAQNLRPLDPSVPADMVIRRDKVLGRQLQIALATDAPMLMLTHGEERFAVRLSGRADVPQVLDLRGEPASVRLDDAAVPDPQGAWARMMRFDGDDTLTISFVAATKAKVQFDADHVDMKAAASFFGIPADPSHPAYQKIARHQAPTAKPATPATPSVPGEGAPASGETLAHTPMRTFTPPPAETLRADTDFPEISTSDLVAQVQPATMWVEAKLPRAGVTATAHGFFVREDGIAAVPLDVLVDASELRVVYRSSPSSEPVTVPATLAAFDAGSGLALVKAQLPEGAKAACLKLSSLTPGTGVKAWVVTAAEAEKAPSVVEGTFDAPLGDHEQRMWQAVRCVMPRHFSGAVVVNPRGEAVAMCTWQWHRTGGTHLMLAAAHVEKLLKNLPATPPQLSELRGMRGVGSLPGNVPAHLRIDTRQPATSIQRDGITLKRGHTCRVCDGKGQVERQIHRQKPGNTGGGKDWFETVRAQCPTCEGGKLGPAVTLGKLIEKAADSLATADLDDAKWGTMRDFLAQTIEEMIELSPDRFRSTLGDASQRVDLARIRTGDAVVAVGLTDSVREPGTLMTPDCALVTPDAGGPPVLMVGMRLNRARMGQAALVGGLFAGQVRLPDGRLAVVLQNGMAIHIP